MKERKEEIKKERRKEGRRERERKKDSSYLHFASLMSKTDSLESNIFIGRLRFRERGGVEGVDHATHARHDLLEAPVVSDAKGVHEALVVGDVVVDFVETNELLLKSLEDLFSSTYNKLERFQCKNLTP